MLAVVDGNSPRAARMLATDGMPVSDRTLAKWSRDTHRQLYLRIRIEMAPHMRAAREERYSRLARLFDRTEPASEAEPTNDKPTEEDSHDR